MDRRRLPLIIPAAIALPLLVSQLLPSANPDRWSPIALGLLAAFGALAGWIVPTIRGWIATAGWVVAGAAVILVTWTDLVLDVAPSILPVTTWRIETFIGIVAAAAIVSVGFVAGALVRRRDDFRPLRRTSVAGVLASVGIGLVAAALTATLFARSGLVVQDEEARLTVVVTDTGVTASPAAIGAGEYRLVIVSQATRPVVIASVIPLDPDDGTPRALTTGEIEHWLAGDWADLGPPFQTAVSGLPFGPGEQRYGGTLQVMPSPDDTGGALWYTAEVDALRPWPAGQVDVEGPEPVPWPVLGHVVVPVGGG